jgi:HAD superfamily hydrolase (TIGR01549 family)
MLQLRGVIFDWRGTLVATPTDLEWCRLALARVGRPADGDSAQRLLRQIEDAPAAERLYADGVDANASVHRETYFSVFADAGLDSEVAEALYTLESDASLNPFAEDAAETLANIKGAGVRIGVLSDIHFDIRPAFATAGLDGFIDAFVLSFERGRMKPDPTFFAECLGDLNLDAGEVLMVGDRATHDGAAEAVGCPVLLLPPLVSPLDRRLHLATSLLVAQH